MCSSNPKKKRQYSSIIWFEIMVMRVALAEMSVWWGSILLDACLISQFRSSISRVSRDNQLK
jgi:hypothetical protein